MLFTKEFNDYRDSKGKPINEECVEKALIHYLTNFLGYTYKEDIKDHSQLKNNFRKQIERLNNYSFQNNEFESWWTSFNSGDVFRRFIELKSNRYVANSKNKKNNIKTLKYFDLEDINNNCFEIVNQLWVNDKNGAKKRFDINILINGIPIIHIELKNESVDVKQASKQIRTYKEIGAISNFLNFTKIFIISNGTNTYYFSNNDKVDHNFVFTWSDEDNVSSNEILSFSKDFLKKEFLIDFISNYFTYDDNKKLVKVFRPYQYHACKKVIDIVNSERKEKSGYIWHATGSGKTMTSFKVCEILTNNPNIYRTIFLIDRLDLNKQTFDNFNKFTTNKNFVKKAIDTENLIDLLLKNDSDKKIIITTIQKLNNALNEVNSKKINSLKNKNILFVVDECHRSQLGIMRYNIVRFFDKAINFAFTGTPIFDINAKDGKTTESIFGPLIHKYTSFNAIQDKNILPIAYTYAQSIELEKNKITSEELLKYEDDLFDDESKNDNVYIDTGRIKAVVDYIKEKYDILTREKKFNAILACSSITESIIYYDLLKNLTDLKIAIVFSVNKSDNSRSSQISKENIEFIEQRIKEYNSAWDISKLTDYKSSIQEDFSNEKERKFDLLIVVSMFLTGFDSPITNTLFLDKQLRYQGLVQAISRTNRLFLGKESGYVVSFRTDIETVNKAFELYTNGGINTPLGSKLWLAENYESIKKDFIFAINDLLKEFSNIDEVADLKIESDIIKFLNKFKVVMHLFNKIKPLPDFKWEDFKIDNRKYNQYLGQYKKHIENGKDSNVIKVYSDYEIVDLETIDIDANYLQNLLTKIKKYDFESMPENIEDFEGFKDLKEGIINNSKDQIQQEVLLNFIKNKQIYKSRTFEEIITLWKKYINSLIFKVEDDAIKKWKTNSKAISDLIEHYKLKKKLTREFILKELPFYVEDELYNDKEFSDVQFTIEKLVSLEVIRENSFR